MSYSPYPSYITAETDIGEPRLSKVWRNRDSEVVSSILLGESRLTFRHPAQARAVAAACTAAAEAMEAMEALEVQAQAEAVSDGGKRDA